MRCQHCGAENAEDARFCPTCGKATSSTEPSRTGAGAALAAAPDLVGREIAGRYRVLAKLGEGGMGAVYRGEQISLKRKVAIKLLRPELSADPGLVRRFNAEAELAARLSHPHTVNIYDFGQDGDGTLFIAMEFLEGRSLRQVITAEGPIPPPRALHVAQQIAASIADAHRHGIVHRDLKPDNVMLTERGRDRDVVRVLDFGIAKLRDVDRGTVNPMTQAGDLVGTPQYMAPEQIRGEVVDGRTDVYALGAILYEMVTGRLPFEGPTVMAVLSKHLLETPDSPARRRPDLGIPPALDATIMHMLAKDPAQRVASMDLAAERLAAIAVELGAAPPAPASTPPPGPAPPPVAAAVHAPSHAAAPPGYLTPHAGPPPGYATPPHAAPPPGYPPPHAAPGYPPPGYAPPPYAAPAPPGGGRTALWVTLAIVAAVGVAVGVLLYARAQRDGGEGPRAGAPSAPAPAEGSTPSTPAGPRPGPAAPQGDVVDLGPYRIVLPLGFIALPGDDALAGMVARVFAGTIEGEYVTLILLLFHEDLTAESIPELDEGCEELASDFLQGRRIRSQAIHGRGAQRYRCTIGGGPQSAEGAVYARPDAALAVFFLAEPHAFDGLAAAREALFDRGITTR